MRDAGPGLARPPAPPQPRRGVVGGETDVPAVLIVVPLSLLSALLFAVGAVLLQRATRRNVAWAGAKHATRPAWVRRVAGRLPASALIGSLLRDPLWRLGWGIQTAGFLTQAGALHVGSTAVVQPLMVTQLLFILLLSAVRAGRRLGRPDWIGGALVCAGLTVLFAVKDAAPVTSTPDRPRLLIAVAVVCIAVSALVVVAGGTANRSPALRAALLAVGAGLFTSLTAALTKMTTFDLFHEGVPATARDWPGYVLAATTALALLLSQDAFAAGPLPASDDALTVTNPIGGYLLGILAFHATPPSQIGSVAAVSAAGLLVITGVIVLARSPNVVGPPWPCLKGLKGQTDPNRTTTVAGPATCPRRPPDRYQPIGGMR
jgi:drug/metabolite transporter (DMT)-like permease